MLKLCMRRAAFSSDLGAGALKVACDVSGLQLKEEGYNIGERDDQVACKCMDGILKAKIEVPDVPLRLNGPGGKVDDCHYLVEQDAGGAYGKRTKRGAGDCC